MSARARTFLAAALSVVGLFTLVSAASALTVQYTPGGPVTASGALSFSAGSLSGTCTGVSLNAALPTGPIPETAGAPLGNVTGGTVAGCNAAGVPVAVTLLLPWVLRFVFRLSPGNLLYDATPAAILIAAGALRCLYRGNLGVLIPAAGNALTLLPMPVPLWLDLNASGLCPANLILSGSLALSPVQRVSEI
ncbi:hypothetical protein Q5424_15165 [Conexibacter sp. JD483]|uniref:hypothetical protein n=1 Tax=unclassified Conexibacter TaxID=2627773 RepID=UPI002717810E|nr:MULTISPECIES: hypothetical protein [unclassified Conexibacter]MDO8188146.1 hypothetical protein [Conexibacter sp. CPCC 205706]MDO8201290.1 hypothetical protein [Conexibacter sp. CPCC 205762]MDR9370438.1 hypothetical protein [Conexibacter sp. JD483]